MMKKLMILPMIGVLFVATVQAQTNYLENGDFEEGEAFRENWQGWYVESSDHSEGTYIPSPEMLSLESSDTPDKSKGALKIQMVLPEDGTVQFSHRAGAMCKLTPPIPQGALIKITFDAKRLEGSPYLKISRRNGGMEVVNVALTDEWEHYEATTASENYDLSEVVFALVETEAPSMGKLAEGAFLIDNLKIIPADEE